MKRHRRGPRAPRARLGAARPGPRRPRGAAGGRRARGSGAGAGIRRRRGRGPAARSGATAAARVAGRRGRPHRSARGRAAGRRRRARGAPGPADRRRGRGGRGTRRAVRGAGAGGGGGRGTEAAAPRRRPGGGLGEPAGRPRAEGVREGLAAFGYCKSARLLERRDGGPPVRTGRGRACAKRRGAPSPARCSRARSGASCWPWSSATDRRSTSPRPRPSGRRGRTTSWRSRAPRWRSWPGSRGGSALAPGRPLDAGRRDRGRDRPLRSPRRGRRAGRASGAHGLGGARRPGAGARHRPVQPPGPRRARAPRRPAGHRRRRGLPALVRRHAGHPRPRRTADARGAPSAPARGPGGRGLARGAGCARPGAGRVVPPPRPRGGRAEHRRGAAVGGGPAHGLRRPGRRTPG